MKNVMGEGKSKPVFLSERKKTAGESPGGGKCVITG